MRRFVSLLLIATIPINLALASNYEGSWKTGFGNVDIQQRAGAFCGTYKSQGFVAGFTNGVFARGIFVHADQNNGKLDNKASNQGLFQWVKKEDGRFDGIWRWGTTVNMSSTKDWNGSRNSERRPAGSKWRKYNGFCLGYIAQLPKAAKDWVMAAKEIDSSAIIASFTDNNKSEPSTPPTQRRSREDNTPHVRTTTGQQLRNCKMGTKYSTSLYCEAQAQSGQAWVATAIDTQLCKPNSLHLPPGSGRLHCEANVSGSFAHSCELMYVSSLHNETIRRGKNPAEENFFITFCEGPKLQNVGTSAIKTLAHTTNRETSYFKKPHKSDEKDIFGRIARDRYYFNRWKATSCPSSKFWNESGYLRCSE